MKLQAWKGFAVGLIASLGLIGSAGAGLARAAAEPEPTFELPAETGEALATIGPGPEPTFDLPTEAREAHATVAPQSEPDFGAQRAQVQEKH